ncbi:MAG: hypothetical protein PVI54_00865 [Desulfobacteraceae bacterium]
MQRANSHQQLSRPWDDRHHSFPDIWINRQNQAIPGLKALYDNPRKWFEAVGEKADLYQLELDLVNDGGDWLVGRARLEGFKGTGF